MKRKIRDILLSIASVGLIIVLTAMGVIGAWSGGDPEAAAEAEFAVVLGAKVNGTTPSRALRARLDVAIDFMELNPNAIVVVCGGQGKDEDITEAQAMYEYLQAHGADVSRVHREDQSTSTRENLLNAQKIIRSLGGDGETVCIISSEFHLCRAEYIARSVGLSPCSLGSKTTPYPYKLFYTFREVPAFAKAILQAL